MKRDIFDIYAKAIAEKFHITLDDLFKKNRSSHLVDARQMLYYLCMERPIRVSYIKRFMEEHGHTVTHSNIVMQYEKAKKLIDNDSDFKNLINDILDK